jgi:TatD DNase family protein
MVPLDRLLIETDSPFLSPVPHRGSRNEPARVVHVAEAIARLRGTTVEVVAEASRDNFTRLFNP